MTSTLLTRGGAIAAALALSAASAQAQQPSLTPGPGSVAPVASINVDGAERMVMACEAWARARGLAPAIWVLDPYGDPVYMSRQTATLRFAVETAHKKAETALAMQASTAELAGRPLTGLDLLPLPGGLPIRFEGQLIGAVGVGGMPGEENGVPYDEACARAAVEAVFGR